MHAEPEEAKAVLGISNGAIDVCHIGNDSRLYNAC